MTSDQLAAIAGLVLSLVFSYTPGLKDLFDKLDATQKRLVMAGLLVIVAAGAFGLSCAKVLAVVTCDKTGALGLVSAFIAALVANQAAFQISPKANSLKQ
jgi:hypothetical protein